MHKDSKGSNLATGIVDLMSPVNFGNLSFQFIYTSADRKIFDVNFEYCSSYGSLPPLVHLIFEVMKKYSNDLIHACPYAPQKRLGVENAPVDALSPLLTVMNFQLGDYKTVTAIRDRKGKLIFYINVYLSLSRKRIQKKTKSG